jgi:ABC-type multidrug transport system fused ATPase/permease subunit
VQFDSSLKLLDTEPEVVEKPDAIALGRARGRVTAEGVYFSYPGRGHTLADVSFDAQAGDRVAIVGHTGAGKSTLMSLLIRFYDPSGGRIAIDGVDVRDVGLQSLRDQISVVLQEPLLFSGTIAENIRYGSLDGTHEQIEAAARAANAHDFVSRLPDGYETVLGEGGSHISGGERQRICVARAFLKDAPILILDEPTSSIDSKTEAVVLDSLDELMEGRTSFIIAHRLSTVRHADQILVMNEGRIVERGTHEELLRTGAVYHQLHEAQTRERKRRVPARAGGNGAAAAVRARETVSALAETVTWRQVSREGEG